MTAVDQRALTRALALIRKVWSTSEPGPWTPREPGQPITRLADYSEAAAIARAERGRALVAQIDLVDHSHLPSDVAATLRVARDIAVRWSFAAEWYWLVFDPTQIGFFAMFAPTAYGGGFLLTSLRGIFAAHEFATAADVDRYLALVSDYARVVRQFDERTRGQFERGIVIPAPELDSSIANMVGLRDRVSEMLSVVPERLCAAGGEEARHKINARISDEVVPAFDRLIEFLSAPTYRERAPDEVGLSQYPGGAGVYESLVRMHLTLDMTPAEVHEAGLARMRTILAQMQDLLDEVGFAGDPHAYLEAIKADPRWRAEGEDAIAAFFRRCLARIEPQVDANFNFRPATGYDVAPLPAALEASMTFGFYDAPKAPGDIGRYVFNSRNLSQSPLMNVPALCYHELLPGHHFHFMSERENDDLHPLRKSLIYNVFNEGWAEYAATLAGELGMYAEPEERFGRLVNDALLTCRLVVDTGMNALGWHLEQARDYMRAHSFMPETEIRSESLRYSCSMPGQALAYKLGDTYLLKLREEMRARLGKRFDIRDFHDAVLKPGALPLPLVKANVEAETARAARAGS
jgi:uncharacterized protein (DUF885 family)